MPIGPVTARIYGWLYRNSAPNRVVVDLAELADHDRALEVGCGPGAAVALAAQRLGPDRVAAVDPSPTFADMARKRTPGADVRVAGAEDIPFDDQSFTAIFSIASMHHWTDRDDGLATMSAKLASGGRLLIAERLLRKPGHGITAHETTTVINRLSGLGLADLHTIERPAGRRRLIVIHARRT